MINVKTKTKYEVGQIYEFRINGIHDDFCELTDSEGFFVYLQHTKGLKLSKGQIIKCRVVANYQKRPKIEFVKEENLETDESKINKESVSKIIDEPEKSWNTEGFISLLLMEEVEEKTFDSECRQWIETLRNQQTDLEQVRTDIESFMQDSDFLSLCNTTEREQYQQRLTQAIDELGYYIQADNLLKNGKAAEFIERILDILEKTGYVYQPEDKFNVLSILFLSDTSLMEENIPRLFDIIRHWPVEIWEKEPFKDALIKSLSLYIDENIWSVDRQSDNGKLVRNLIQALSILYIITGDRTTEAHLPDERIILSRLSVLSTYIGDYGNKELLSLAIGELLSDNYYRPKFSLEDTENQTIPSSLKTRALRSNLWPVNTTNSFPAERTRLDINSKGITIYSDSQKAKPVIPSQLQLWGNMQVCADHKNMPPLSGDITISDSKHLWQAIERELFTPDRLTQVKESIKSIQQKNIKPTYDVGDTVRITINRIDDNENENGDNRAYCTIVGDNKESGYIYGKDIVSYMHHVALWMFQDMNHNPLTFEATIMSIDGDGMFHFSMLDEIKEFVCNQYSFDNDVICSLGSFRRASADSYSSPAITEQGYSVSLNGSIGEDLQKGDIVLATYQGRASGSYHILCNVKDRFDGHKVDLVRAFHNLMDAYAIPAEEENDEKEEEKDKVTVDFDNTDRVLDKTYVREIIRIIDRLAVIEEKYVRSYNYIAFARVLCEMTGWTERADYYRGRMQLIEMLYEFAKNDTVDASQLERFNEEASNFFLHDTTLREKFQQLRIISFMGSQAHDEELMKFRSESIGLTRQVASLAFAYNILLENKLKPQANDVLNHIKGMLNLHGYESNLKVYADGLESSTVEFKTSIVYPPENNSYPDIKRQTHTILSVIAAFLNTQGGTLYLGVNNSGAGIGLYNDLYYQDFNGDKDQYQRYVTDQVALQWDNNVASYVSADWDNEETNGKDILVVKVEPYLKGVELDGEWIYRNGAGNRHLTKEEFAEYNVRRTQRLKTILFQSNNIVFTTQKDSSYDAKTTVSKPSSNPSDSKTVTTAVKVDRILTSCQRENILEDWKDGYIPYESLLKFMPKGKVQRLVKNDFDDSSLLTLPVYEDDVKDRFLILGYEEGTIAKVPIKEVMQFDVRRDYNRYTGSQLLFASIASEDDGIITVSEEDKTGHRSMVRTDSLSNIDRCRIADGGSRVYNDGIASKVLKYEIAPAEYLPAIKNILNKDARTLGFPLATLSDDIKQVLEKCKVE